MLGLAPAGIFREACEAGVVMVFLAPAAADENLLAFPALFVVSDRGTEDDPAGLWYLLLVAEVPPAAILPPVAALAPEFWRAPAVRLLMAACLFEALLPCMFDEALALCRFWLAGELFPLILVLLFLVFAAPAV